MTEPVIVCRCGKSNPVGSVHCVRCEDPLLLAEHPPKPEPGESYLHYIRRAGPIIQWRTKQPSEPLKLDW